MLTTFQLLAPDYQADPYPSYARMREEGLSLIQPSGNLAVSRYSDVLAALRNPSLFSNAGFSTAWEPEWFKSNPCAHSMHSLDPPDHTKMRNLVNTAFLPPVIERTAPIVQASVDAAVGAFAERGEAEIVSEIALPVTAGTIGHFLNLDPALHGRFKGWSDAMMSIKPVPKSPEHAEQVRTQVHEMAQFMRSLVEKRRCEPGDDMASLLVQAEIDGQRLTERQLVPFLSTLLIGGLDTTTNLITNSMRILAERQDILDRLRADPSVVPRFVDEMLRFDPPTHGLLRLVKGDTEIVGQPVPAGAIVILMIASANRDPSQFPNPDVLDIDRDTRGLLAFGQGAHFCIGMGLAKLETRLVLTEMVRRFRRFERVDPTLTWNHTLVVRGITKLPLRGVLA
jgi:cytochrome P450